MAAAPKSRFDAFRLAVAVIVLALGAQRHFVYYGWDGEDRGLIAKACGGVAVLGLVWLVYSLKPSRLLLLVAAWLTVGEGMVIGCPLAYMVAPWEIPPGGDMCSARLTVHLVVFELVAAAWLAHRIVTVISDRSETSGGR